MSEVNETTAPVATAPETTEVAAPAPVLAQISTVPATPAKAPTAIQIVEQEVAGFIKQRETAIANVHAIEGAIQAGQLLLSKFRAQEQKAVAAVKAEVGKIETEVETVATEAKSKVVEFEAAAKKLV